MSAPRLHFEGTGEKAGRLADIARVTLGAPCRLPLAHRRELRAKHLRAIARKMKAEMRYDPLTVEQLLDIADLLDGGAP